MAVINSPAEITLDGNELTKSLYVVDAGNAPFKIFKVSNNKSFRLALATQVAGETGEDLLKQVIQFWG